MTTVSYDDQKNRMLGIVCMLSLNFCLCSWNGMYWCHRTCRTRWQSRRHRERDGQWWYCILGTDCYPMIPTFAWQCQQGHSIVEIIFYMHKQSVAPVIMQFTTWPSVAFSLYTWPNECTCTQTTLRKLKTKVSTVAHSLEDETSVGCLCDRSIMQPRANCLLCWLDAQRKQQCNNSTTLVSIR